jgi:hypothetical protein
MRKEDFCNLCAGVVRRRLQDSVADVSVTERRAIVWTGRTVGSSEMSGSAALYGVLIITTISTGRLPWAVFNDNHTPFKRNLSSFRAAMYRSVVCP